MVDDICCSRSISTKAASTNPFVLILLRSSESEPMSTMKSTIYQKQAFQNCTNSSARLHCAMPSWQEAETPIPCYQSLKVQHFETNSPLFRIIDLLESAEEVVNSSNCDLEPIPIAPSIANIALPMNSCGGNAAVTTHVHQRHAGNSGQEAPQDTSSRHSLWNTIFAQNNRPRYDGATLPCSLAQQEQLAGCFSWTGARVAAYTVNTQPSQDVYHDGKRSQAPDSIHEPRSKRMRTKPCQQDQDVAVVGCSNFTAPPSAGGWSVSSFCPMSTSIVVGSESASILDSITPKATDLLFEPLPAFLPCTTSSATISLTSESLSEQQDQDNFSLCDTTKNRPFRPYQADQWAERFQELVQFKAQHGHTLVPHSYPPNPLLAQWIKRQRYQYKLKHLGRHSTLTDARQQELEAMGFCWDSHKAAWDEKFQALQQYHAQHGNCRVPPSFRQDPSLAIWVKCQRRQWKLFRKGHRSTITQERIDELDQLGFEWNPRYLE